MNTWDHTKFKSSDFILQNTVAISLIITAKDNCIQK